MKKLKMGVIGAGKIAQVLHIPNIALSNFAELVAISDPRKERLDYFKQRYPGLHTYSDYQELLKDDLDAVVVAVPNYLHSEVSIKSLESKKHVLVEKPMASSSNEAKEMILTAEKYKKVLMVNHSQRFFPHHQKVKEIIDSGLIGTITMVKTMFSHSGPEDWSPTASWFFDKKSAAFGALADLGVHKVDLIRFLTGLEITECFSLTATLEKKATVEDFAVGILKLSNGGFAELTANWITHGLEENYISIYGSKGTVKVGVCGNDRIDIYVSEPVKFHGEINVKPLYTNEDEYWKTPVIDHFAKVCLNLEPAIVKAEDGYIALLVVEKMLESTKRGVLVSLKI
ncbi:MAG: gfo/Idh/MocA family oxidoreductase [Thermotogae bacterium]|nr:MAG: gfo/Idh/MocA family oxidoreductase [Thermotogota bacterium]